MLLPSWIVCLVFILALQVESLAHVKTQDIGIASQKKKAAWGRRRRRRRRRATTTVKQTTTNKPQTLYFGGKHGSWTLGGTFVGYNRPEVVKMQVCEDDGPASCSECTDQSACWHASSKTVSNHDGGLQLDVPASSPHKRFVAEMWASCSNGNGVWLLKNLAAKNGILSVYVNDELLKTAVGLQKTVTIPVVKDSRVRVEFVRTDTATRASSLIFVWADHVDAYVDNCMDVKNCLADLGDGTDAAFRFRNSNAKQLQCIHATTKIEQNTVSDHCRPWVTCLSKEPGRKDKLKILLKAAIGKDADQGQLLSRTGTSSFGAGGNPGDGGGCIDPALEDAESWECECMAEMAASCGGADEACFRTIICRQNKVCKSWKDKNCDASFSLIAKQNGSIKENALFMRRGVVAASVTHDAEVLLTRQSGSLDGSLQGKCTSETQ